MHKRIKLLMVGLGAALLLALATGGAMARSFSLSDNTFSAKWAGLRFIAAGRTVVCPVTLEGTFHSRTLAKVVNSLLGFVTRAIVNNAACTGGGATVLSATLPWHITYRSFTGTLPNIERIFINLINASFRVQPSGSVACLARTSTTNPAVGFITLSRGTATSLTADETAEIPLTGAFGFCSFGGEGHFGGTTTSLRTLNGLANITVTLI